MPFFPGLIPVVAAGVLHSHLENQAAVLPQHTSGMLLVARNHDSHRETLLAFPNERTHTLVHQQQ